MYVCRSYFSSCYPIEACVDEEFHLCNQFTGCIPESSEKMARDFLITEAEVGSPLGKIMRSSANMRDNSRMGLLSSSTLKGLFERTGGTNSCLEEVHVTYHFQKRKPGGRL